MKLSVLKSHLSKLSKIGFQLPNGELVPAHFHVTEIGKVSKTFIDCGGKIRNENCVSLQLWEENDYDHRLHPEKLISIIEFSEKKLELPDLDVDVEYQGETIGRYDLHFNGMYFLLENKSTACLAQESCGIQPKKRIKMSNLSKTACEPNSGCC